MEIDLLDRPVRNESLSAQVVEILKDGIFSGKLRPGEPLREMQVAKTLKVSQATVRQALADMERVGLVERIPNRGTTVTNLSSQEIRDRLRMRVALEELAWADAAQRVTEDDLQELERLGCVIRDAVSRGAYFEMSQADLHFHRTVWEKAGSRILYRTLDQLTTPLFAFLGLHLKINRIDLAETKSHEELIAALRTGERTAICSAIRDHITGSSYNTLLKSNAENLQVLVESSR